MSGLKRGTGKPCKGLSPTQVCVHFTNYPDSMKAGGLSAEGSYLALGVSSLKCGKSSLEQHLPFAPVTRVALWAMGRLYLLPSPSLFFWALFLLQLFVLKASWEEAAFPFHIHSNQCRRRSLQLEAGRPPQSSPPHLFSSSVDSGCFISRSDGNVALLPSPLPCFHLAKHTVLRDLPPPA